MDSMKNDESFNIKLSKIKREDANKRINSYFQDVIHPYFPNCYPRQITDEYIDGVHLSFGAIINFEPINSLLCDSDYYYNKRLEFIHYTSLNNCLNILREKSLRMYSINSMDDSFELKYASKNIFKGLSSDQINVWKSNIYSFSMCEMSVENKKESLDFWKKYGNDGYGVGLVLSIDKENQKYWYNRYLSKIHYGSKLIDEIVSKHKQFLKNQEVFHILGDNQELLLNLCCFHKPPIYKTEKEIRFLELDKCPSCGIVDLNFQHVLTGNEFPIIFVERDKNAWKRYEQKLSPNINTSSEIDISRNLKPVRFKRIAITESLHNELIDKIECPYIEKNKNLFFPKFKIKKVIIGYRYKDTDLENIRATLKELSKNHLGYEFDVEMTKLNEFF